jgi:hypothetical protein
MGNMHLVIVFLGAGIKREQEGDHGNQVRESQLLKIFPEADDKCHYQEVREIKKVFAGPEPFHIVHDDQVKVQGQNGNYTGKQVFAS